MSVFAIVHGAGGTAWEWHRTTALLRDAGHEVVAIDLPCEDDTKDFPAYADAVVEAVGIREGVTVVATSLGGFTGPLVAARLPGASLVMAAAMVPRPGESVAEWWAATGHRVLDPDEDEVLQFLHDVDEPMRSEALRHGQEQSDRPMRDPWPLEAWPDVPTSGLLFADDRFFPLPFMRALYRDRLGITDPAVVPGGHCAYLSRPEAVATALMAA